MKIAILTQPLQINYGGILQAFAVQKILKNMGHEVVTLDIPWKDTGNRVSLYIRLRLFIATLLLFLLNRLKAKDIVWPYNTRKRNRDLINHAMRPFINHVINLSPVIDTEDTLKDYMKEQNFSVCVVGSDQVWRPMYSPNIGWYFLNFLPEDVNIKRIAFSASFGTSDWEFSKEQTKGLKPFAKKFDAISVRETSGVYLCKKYLEVPAIQVVDPCMMLTCNDYAELMNLDKHNTFSMKGVMFSYVLDETKEKQTIVNCISEILKLSVQILKVENYKYGPYASRKEVLKYMPAPVSQWLRGFQESEFVVTDSFHGTVFSILHHRPFVVVANKARGLARIETLLNTFDLKERLIETTANCSREWLLSGIQWNKVDTVLQERREFFKNFIDNALKN